MNINYSVSIAFYKRCMFLFTQLFLLSGILAISSQTVQGSDDNLIWKFDYREIFYDIAFPDHQNAVVVGAFGRVLLTHDKYKNLWQIRNSNTKELLTCVSFVDEKNGWAAGHGGVIIHTGDGGQTWKIQRESSMQNQPLFDIYFTSERVGYACGNFETLIKTTDGGKSWRNLSLGLDDMFDAGLFGLFFLDDDTGYAVGEFGGIVRTKDGGKTWHLLKNDDYQGSFFGILPLSDGILLVYGISGKIMRSDDNGKTWGHIAVDTKQRLFRAAFNGKDVVVAGSSGTLLVSHDLGKSFIPFTHNKNVVSFAGICPHPEDGFVCVGERGTIYHINPSRK